MLASRVLGSFVSILGSGVLVVGSGVLAVSRFALLFCDEVRCPNCFEPFCSWFMFKLFRRWRCGKTGWTPPCSWLTSMGLYFVVKADTRPVSALNWLNFCSSISIFCGANPSAWL